MISLLIRLLMPDNRRDYNLLTLLPYYRDIPMHTISTTTERIAFAIVPVEVRYPDRIVGIALLL